MREGPKQNLHCLLPSSFRPFHFLPTLTHSTLILSLSNLPPQVTATGNIMSDHLSPHPSFEVLGGAQDRFLPAFGTLDRPYNAFPVIGWNRHLETLFASYCRTLPDVRLRREYLRTNEDGSVAIDWVCDDDNLPSHSPILILLPGLTGGSQETYIRHMLVRARSKGWRVVVFNSRSCCNSPDITTKFYSASYMGEMDKVVTNVAKLYPKSNLYAVGWSYGANILVQYLGQESHSCALSGAVSLCNPFNLVIADENIRKGLNNFYGKYLAASLSKTFKNHAHMFEDIGGDYNIQSATNAKSLREFDDGLTRVSFGFKSVDEYYSKTSSSNFIKYVRTPLLCIQAANDPIAPSRGIPREDIKENPNCLLIVTPQGGHLGWVAGDEAPRGAPWTDKVVMDFLEYLEKENSQVLPSSSSRSEYVNQSTLHQRKNV